MDAGDRQILWHNRPIDELSREEAIDALRRILLDLDWANANHNTIAQRLSGPADG